MFPTLLFTLLLSLSACTEQKDEATLLNEAKTQYDNGEFSTATISLKNILQKNPEQAEARYLLGAIYLNKDQFLAAEKEFRRAISQNPEHEEALLALAKAQLSLNKFEKVLSTLSAQTFQQQTSKIRALIMQSQAYLSLDKLTEAMDFVDKANTIDNQSKYSQLGSALIAAYQENTDQAIATLSQILQQNPQFHEATLLKGSVHSKAHQYKQAAITYLEYYHSKPENFAIRVLIAHNYIKAGEYEAAKPHIEALRKHNDNNPTVNILAAQIAYVEQNFELAKSLANKALNNTDNSLAQMLSGLSSFQLGENEQAYYQLNAISDYLPKNHQVNKLLAILQVKLGYDDELTTQLNHFSNDANLYANLGKEYANLGDVELAKEMFNSAAQLAPDNAQFKALLGMFKLANDDNSGIKELEQAVQLAPQFKSANIALALNYADAGKIEEAEKIAKRWIKQNPKSTAGLILNGNIAIKANKKEDAKAFFTQALALEPNNIVPLFNLAVIAAENKNYAESNKQLDKLFSIDLEYPYAYRLAIDNAVAENNDELLEQKILKFIDSSPTAVWPRIILARRYAIKNKLKDGFSILEPLDDYSKLPNAYFQTLQNILLQTKQSDKLSAVYIRWQQAQPKNESAFLSQIKWHEQQQNYQDALVTTRQALSLEQFKQNFQLQSLEAYYLLATSQFSLAEKSINRLAAIQPEHAFILRIQGQLAMAKKDYAQAIKYLLNSYHVNPQESTAIYLASSYRENNEINKAINIMAQLAERYPNKVKYKSLLAELYISSSTPEKAIQYYAELLTITPNNVSMLNNLAWIYAQQNEFAQAEKHARKATELAPENPDILDTYGTILTKQNKLAEAIEVLTRANQYKPNNKEIMTHLSSAYKANNQPKLAEQIMNTMPSS